MPGSPEGSDHLPRLRVLLSEARVAAEQPALSDPISVTAPLAGYVDSMAVAVLVGLIEEEWQIELNDEDIDPESFADLKSLAALIERKRVGDPA